MTNNSADVVVAPTSDDLDHPNPLASAFEPLSRSLFQEAGLSAGMRVLDVGSGPGDLAFVAREIVGADGHVIGFDWTPEMVPLANARATLRGLHNVSFVEGQIGKLPFDREFHAIVGRLCLMYRPDPVADLRALTGCLRPGGVVVFQELDFLPGKTVPPAKLINDVRAWLLDSFARAGVELEMGPKLYSTFKAAGLSSPEMRVDGFIGGESSVAPALVAHVARMLLPQAEALGAISSKEVDIDTLEQRMRAELAHSGGVMSTPLLIGTWARLPA